MHYEIVSDREVTVDGIGLLEAGKSHVITDEEFYRFVELNKITGLVDIRLPEFVQFTLVLDEGGE